VPTLLGGLLIDASVIGAIGAFAWAGTQLGAVASLWRAMSCLGAFAVAALTRDPAGDIVGLLGVSDDLARLIAMIVVGFGAFFAIGSILRWALNRGAVEPDVELDEYGGLPEEDAWRGSAPIAAIAGGALGVCWALLFVSLLVLMPAASPVSSAAIDSHVGEQLISHEGGLRWLGTGFPHYTQTLPKGEQGAVVGEQVNVNMRGPIGNDKRPTDIEIVLDQINDARRARTTAPLEFNANIAGVAQRHALDLAQDRTLSYTSPGGGSLDGRVSASLGESSVDFEEQIGLEVAWAHGPGNAARQMLEDGRARRLLLDSKWYEIGIGVIDAGWFNGRIYVLVLVAAVDPADPGGDGAGATPEDAGGDLVLADPTTQDTNSADPSAADPVGVPRPEESVAEPDLALQ